MSADFLPGRNYFCLMYMSYKQGGSAIKSAQTRKIFSNTKPRKGEDYWIWFDNFFILSCIDYYHTMVFLFFILFFYFLGYTELFLIQIVKRKINFWWTAEAAVHRCSIKMHFWLDLKFFEKKKRGSGNAVFLSVKKKRFRQRCFIIRSSCSQMFLKIDTIHRKTPGQHF